MQFIDLRKAELGAGFTIGRALPTRERRMIGAWCFLDHLGPVDLRNHDGMHVQAHPHTCLQTFTWMIEGEILHRDSLGSEQLVKPGQVNLMTAGRGIAHTEDSLPGERLHAAQLWIALPAKYAEVQPAFDHYPQLPQWSRNNIEMTLLAGEFQSVVAPTRVYSPLVEPGGEALHMSLSEGTRCLLIGGEPFPSRISMWWNFVGHTREYIYQAYQDWQSDSDRFPLVPGASIKLPSPPPPASFSAS